ncbi:MAG: hypothetical protein ACPG5B_12850 [Chitinophagales bacterium]
MKKLIFLLTFCLLCIITNPSNEKHKNKLNADFKNKHSIIGSFGVGNFAASLFPYHNFYFFSIKGDKEKIHSVGFLGMVFVNPESF